MAENEYVERIERILEPYLESGLFRDLNSPRPNNLYWNLVGELARLLESIDSALIEEVQECERRGRALEAMTNPRVTFSGDLSPYYDAIKRANDN